MLSNLFHSPSLVIPLYVLFRILEDVFESYFQAYLDGVCNRDVKDLGVPSRVTVNLKFEYLGIIMGVVLLFLFGTVFTQHTPPDTFSFLVGFLFISHIVVFLTNILPAFVQWRMLYNLQYTKSSVQNLLRIRLAVSAVQQLGCSIMFVFLWTLTDEIVFLGTATASMLCSLLAYKDHCQEFQMPNDQTDEAADSPIFDDKSSK